MCVIYACYKGMPDDNELRRGSTRNDDGAGICWVTPKEVKWIKGLKSEPDAVKQAIKDNKITYPFAIHFRSASVGGVDMDLTHPFPISEGTPVDLKGSARRVLMHNGHLGNWKNWLVPALLASDEFCPEPPWSDSRALAHLVHLKGEGILEFLIESSRVMVMDNIPSEGWDPKNPLSYFRLYGTWVHDKAEGYYQSVQTFDTVIRGKDMGVDSLVGTTPTCGVGGSTTGSTGSMGTTTGATTSPRENSSEWTIDELEELAMTLEREQADARKQLSGN